MVFYGRNALLQPSVTALAAELGIVLLAVDAKNAFDAKKYVLRNAKKVRHTVTQGSSAIINSQRRAPSTRTSNLRARPAVEPVALPRGELENACSRSADASD